MLSHLSRNRKCYILPVIRFLMKFLLEFPWKQRLLLKFFKIAWHILWCVSLLSTVLCQEKSGILNFKHLFLAFYFFFSLSDFWSCLCLSMWVYATCAWVRRCPKRTETSNLWSWSYRGSLATWSTCKASYLFHLCFLVINMVPTFREDIASGC